MKNLLVWLFALTLPILHSGLRAQTLLPEDPDEFIQAFSSKMSSTRQAGAREVNIELGTLWRDGTASEADKAAFIKLVNQLQAKSYGFEREVTLLTQLYNLLLKADHQVALSRETFVKITEKCIQNLVPKRLNAYFLNLYEFLPKGYMSDRKKFYWKSSQLDPRLKFISLEEKGKTYQTPVLRFTQTDLSYVSDRDSTFIFGTSGDYNLISKGFLGLGGQVTWEKMKLPADDVYVMFKDYRLNFNYGKVSADSVTFYYKSIIDRPLGGKYEDLNLGYKNLNRANYPSFKSYDGNVVIENFIPNVRYDGGFSLKGIRKIGSAYDIWVDYVPPITDEGGFIEDGGAMTSEEVEEAIEETYDEYGIDEWSDEEEYGEEYYDDYYEEGSYETDDDYYDGYEEEGSGYEDETYAEDDYPEDGFSEIPDFGLPSKVLKHVKAKLEIMREDTVVMRLAGEEFVLDMEKMVGKSAETTIFLSEQDSMSHPGMDLLYDVGSQEAVLVRPKRSATAQQPFSSSFHEFYLYFESIVWNLNTTEMHFTAFIDRENKLAAIESFDFFNKYRFDSYKGILPFNPIGAIYRYNYLYPAKPIFPEEILKEYKLPNKLTAFKRALPRLEGAGYLTYDRASTEIKPTPKLIAWAKAARKKKDYDALQLVSKVDTGSHAIMDVVSKEVSLRGVPFFSLSDSQYLRVVPIDGQVNVLQKRNLQFGGAIAAGKLNFYANREGSFSFDYESFKILCDSVDSMRFVLVRNPPKGYEPTPLEQALSNTVFEGVTGAIHIDAPNNKSGNKKFPQYPIFDSFSDAYVYWARPNVQDGIYTKDKLYFGLDPFILDSLEDFDESNLTFEGEFFSSEIFPKFRQSLMVMEDFTLGFNEETPENGYYCYDNKGLFYNEISMDGNGLQGNGRLEVIDIDMIVESDSFMFHFDSVMATVQNFRRESGYRNGNYYPELDASSARYIWYTKENRVTLESLDEPIRVFGGEAEFTGRLNITPGRVIGNGSVVLGQVKIEGDSILFNEMDFSSASSDFVILDEFEEGLVHFKAENVQVNYDVYDHVSNFSTTEVGNAQASFPIHQYRTSMAKGEYRRENNELLMEGVSSYIRDNFFVSTKAEMDSLKFNAKESLYKVDDRTIEVYGVPYIYVADATVTPDKLEVTILETGLIKRLENAVIEANQQNKFHKVYEANVDIYSAYDYEASGMYDYIVVKGQQQFIKFSKLEVNSDTTSIGEGDIPESQQFYLTERIFFKGKARVNASRKFLEFEGEVKIESENPAFKGTWFPFAATVVNPDSVFIPIEKRIYNDDKELLTVGLNFQPEPRVFYSNFLQPIRDEADYSVVTASGGLTFDRRTKEFRIGSEEKITGQSLKGSTVSFNDSLNIITSHGLLNFPEDFAKNTIDLKFSGDWSDNLTRRQLSTSLIVGVGFSIMPEEPLKKVSDNLLYLTANNADIDFNRRAMQENIAELLDEGKTGDKETRRFIEDVRNAMVYTDIKLAKELPFTLLLSDVNFNYSREYKALYCNEDVGLLGLGGTPINKMVSARMVYKFGAIDGEGEKVPDRFDVYLEVDEFNWIFFRFSGEVVYTTSSYYDDYNVQLQLEIDKRKKAEGFRFELLPEDDVNKFKQEYVKKYIVR